MLYVQPQGNGSMNDSYTSSIILRPKYEIKNFRSFSRSDAVKAMGHDATQQNCAEYGLRTTEETQTESAHNSTLLT
jgi:hypothetical protein